MFALSLKKVLIPDCETVASNKLLKLVKLGLAVSKCKACSFIGDSLDLEDSDLSKDFTQIAHAFQPNHNNSCESFKFISHWSSFVKILIHGKFPDQSLFLASFFSNSSSSSNNQSVDQSPQQSLQQNGSQNAQFSLGVSQSIKLEPGDHAFNSLNLPLGAYQRQWAQVSFTRVKLHTYY